MWRTKSFHIHVVFYRHTRTHSAPSQGYQGSAQVQQFSAKFILCLLAGFIILCTVLGLSQLPELHQRVNRISLHLLAKYFKHTSSKSSPVTLKSRANKNMLRNYILGYPCVESFHLQILQKLGNHISISLLEGQKLRFLKVREKARSLKAHSRVPNHSMILWFQRNMILCSFYLHQRWGSREKKSGCQDTSIFCT